MNNDFKELLEDLRKINSISWDARHCVAEDAAEAIEKLVDKLAKVEKALLHQIEESFRQLEVIMERDETVMRLTAALSKVEEQRDTMRRLPKDELRDDCGAVFQSGGSTAEQMVEDFYRPINNGENE